ncbi:MAG: hypothetical protein JJE07_05965 [Flavobacteriaceae bacterium]|nr:hypothetical protein [Flavobacteriaceae bacterium]
MIFGLISFLVFTAGAQDISGEWHMNSNDGEQIFTLSLVHITKDRVKGVHCIENFEKEITECFKMEDNYTVNLVKINENIFQGILLSGIGGNKIAQDIQVQYLPLDDRLLFKLTKIPEGEFLIPVEAVLERK